MSEQEYRLECYKCDTIYHSNDDLEDCPKCGESENIGVDFTKEFNDE
jgi:rRNA maturation endonuclease Nob1